MSSRPTRLTETGNGPTERAIRFAGQGALVALPFLAIGVVRALLVVVAGTKVDFSGMGRLAALYVASFAVAGAALGLFWNLRRQALGRVAIGVLMAAIIGMGCLFIISPNPRTWGFAEAFTEAFMTLAFGLLAASMLKKHST